MDYRFTGILIILMCLLAFCVRPVDHPPLKTNEKKIILPKPKPKVDDEAAWNEIEWLKN